MIKEKKMWVAYLLWFFLGGVGAHRFYLGKVETAWIMVGLSVVGVLVKHFAHFSIMPILFIWIIVDAFLIPRYVRTYGGEDKQVPYVE